MPSVTASAPMGARPSEGKVTELQLLAAVLGLMFIAVPVLSIIAPAASDAVAVGTALFAIMPIATRLNRDPRLSLAVLAFVGSYAVSAFMTGQMSQQGGRHVLTTFAAGSALLLFASYGKEMLGYLLFNQLAEIVIFSGLVAVNASAAPKNIVGGTMLYLFALLMIIRIVRKPERSWVYSKIFFVVTVGIALLFDFRSLVAYALILILGYLGATKFSRRTFWLLGVVGLSVFNAVMAWYFLSIFTDPRAITFSHWIVEVSGRPATSGREVLWSAITRQVRDDKLFGLGAGYLPRDFLPTNLSSHSHYFQVYLQLGLVGLALLIFVLLAVWKVLARAKSRPAQFGAAIFLMFVAHNSTEVLMFQNGLIAGIPAWCAIGLAVSLAKAERSAPELGQTQQPAKAVRSRRAHSYSQRR